MEAHIRTLIAEYFRLINEERFDEFFALFDPDVEFHAPFGYSAHGIEQVKPFYLRVPEEYPIHVDVPTEILVSENKAAVFIDVHARTRNGLTVAFKAADWFTFKNGKIVSLFIFFDSFHLANLSRAA